MLPLAHSAVSDVWTSALLGIALGAANAAASYALYRVAGGKPQKAFFTIVLGGMVARLLGVLALAALILVMLPVSRTAFVGAFFAAFAVGTAVELLLIQRRASRAQL